MLIKTVKSGREFKGHSEWDVTFTNRCSCPVKTIVLSCQGFRSAKPISSSLLNVNGDRCLLYSGIQLKAGGSLSFSYAWDSAFHFTPLYILPMGC
ncbi:unnamed protein product [Linum tenue]|nr:unnamed protein product [Linum tenue]